MLFKISSKNKNGIHINDTYGVERDRFKEQFYTNLCKINFDSQKLLGGGGNRIIYFIILKFCFKDVDCMNGRKQPK